MSSDIIIAAHHISKLFSRQKQKTLKEMLPALIGRGKKGVVDSFWALNDINFEVKKGESFGIVGPNGSGKSTLLKILAGVIEPTKGTFTTQGVIAPLLELGAGFHPEMTGRENIYLNSIILGDLRKDVDKKIDQIIDFSEIREFIDVPVKHYSSGMYTRLAFSVAIFTNFDILLADEILAVGDSSFQKKCLTKMKEFQAQGRTIVLVSHSSHQIKEMCQKALYINHGEQIAYGDVTEVLAQYEN